MHELAITMSILSIVLEQAKVAQAGKITKINLSIGGLSGIVPECVQFQFNILNRSTIASEASLSFHQLPSSLRCRNCDTTYSPEDLHLACPNCGQHKFEIISGRECYVESIEVE